MGSVTDLFRSLGVGDHEDSGLILLLLQETAEPLVLLFLAFIVAVGRERGDAIVGGAVGRQRRRSQSHVSRQMTGNAGIRLGRMRGNAVTVPAGEQ